MIIRSAITGLTLHCLNMLRNNSKKGSYSISTTEFSLLAFGILTALWSKPTQNLFNEVRKKILNLQLLSIHADKFSVEIDRITSVRISVMMGEPGAENFKRRTERDLKHSSRNHNRLCEITKLKSRSEIRRFNSHFSSNPLQNIFWPLFCLRNFQKIRKQVPFPEIDSSVTPEALLKEASRETIDASRACFPTSANRRGQRDQQLTQGCSFVGEEMLNRLQPIVFRQQAKIREILNCYRDREELERELMPGNFDQDEPHLEEIPAKTG